MRRELGNRTIPRPEGQALFYKDGDTADIATKVLKVYSEQRHQVAAFAPHLKGSTLYDTCHNIWRMVKENIRYQTDPKNNQWVRRPAQMWWSGVGDCKSYSVFIASCLDALGIVGTFRFVSYEKPDPVLQQKMPPTHVYVVVKNNGREIILDAVMPGFNQEKKFESKYDYNMTRIYELSGINQQPRRKAVYYTDGTAQIEGGLSTLVLGKKRREVLQEAMPGLALMALYIFIPAGQNPEDLPKEIKSQYATNDNLLNRCPSIVVKKRGTAVASFWDFGDWAGIKVENDVFPQLRKLLSAQLGMDPTEWWRKALVAPTNSNARITGPTSEGGSSSSSSSTGTGGDAAGAAASSTPEGQAITMALQKVTGIINSIFGGTDIKWKRGDPSQWKPDSADWDGFPVNPLLYVPMGSPSDPRPVNVSYPIPNQPQPLPQSGYNPPPANTNQAAPPPAADKDNTGLIIAAVVVVGILAFKK